MYTLTKDNGIDNGSGMVLPPTNNGTDAWRDYQAWLDAGNTPAPYVAPPAPPEQFSKLDIVRAMRRLGTESQLDTLLAASPLFAKDWDNAQTITLSDPMTAAALAQASIDVAAVIAEIHKGA